MSGHQTITFQEAIDMVESLPEDQQESLIGIIRGRLIEHKREVLAERIREAREEHMRGDVRRGTAEELIKEITE